MELTELVYFTTIAQTGNMSRAAKKLQVSQPALSVAVRKLERDLNMQLFVRANNSIILNAAGKKAVVFAENILSQVSEMRHFFRTYGERNTAASLAFTDPGPYRLVLPFFQQKCTQTKISSLLLHADNEVGPTLEEKKADAVICLSLPRKNKKDFESISVAKEGLYLAVPKNHPLAKRKYIRLDKEKNLDLAVLSEGGAYAQYLVPFWEKFSKRHKITIYSDYESFKQAAQQNPQQALVLIRLARRYYQETYGRILMPINDKGLSVLYYLVYLKKNAECLYPILHWAKTRENKLLNVVRPYANM